MITVYKEVTEWVDNTHNGIYHLDSNNNLVAYQRTEDDDVVTFSKPLQFSKTRRKFIKIRKYSEAS